MIYKINSFYFCIKSMPRIPCLKREIKQSTFYGPNDSMPIVLAIIMGIQRKIKYWNQAISSFNSQC